MFATVRIWSGATNWSHVDSALSSAMVEKSLLVSFYRDDAPSAPVSGAQERVLGQTCGRVDGR
ncbi:MAG TPA: hypothetical protein VGI49_04325, partial [Mycobacterium sp.]